MHLITSSFMNMVLVGTVVFVLVQVFYYFRFRGDVNLSDFDKSFWQLRLFTFFFGALIVIAALYLPATGFYREIDISATARETAFQDLVHNQLRMGTELHQLREILYVVFIVLMVHLFGAATLMGRLWRERQRLASADKPEIKKPLGLETN
jgi:FlaA1/EpsC-like NDP-sugar epimerase